ncbi:MAG: hypothetical protein N4A53_14110 [Pelagimonas sp.]|jgi:hypothetical protein|nr:hypothetical protein [Pelagimonas sp.]
MYSVFALLLIGLLVIWFIPGEREVKPRPEYYAEVSPTAGSYREFSSRGFDYGDPFDLRVHFVMKEGVDFADIDLTFDCWMSAMKPGFGVQPVDNPSFVPLCDPLEVEPRLYGLELFVTGRPDSGVAEYLMYFGTETELQFTYESTDLLSMDGHIQDGEIAISAPKADTGLPVLAIYLTQPKGSERRTARSFYEAFPITPSDISNIHVTITRK